MRLKRIVLGLTVLAAAALAIVPGVVSARQPRPRGEASSAVPHYRHIVEIMMENTSYGSIIGNPLAPHLNALADRYGLATNYFGVTHPSEPNYIANIGGSYFGIQDDNQFYCTPALAATDPTCSGTTVNHTVSNQSLADQLTAAGQSWKGYFQNLPYVDPGHVVDSGPGANGPYAFKWPSNSNALYASKHNPFINFSGTQHALSQMVPDNQLGADLLSGQLPNYSLVVPDQCHDMHGTGGCSATNGLIAAGDQYVNTTVSEVMASRTWREGNNAIVITWDEDDYSDQGQPGTGCCGANPGGGHVATIVITNHRSAHVSDNTAYNHYSLLRTLEAAFGLPCLAHACDSVVPTMAPLFAGGPGEESHTRRPRCGDLLIRYGQSARCRSRACDLGWPHQRQRRSRMFRHIVVGCDGSPEGNDAVALGARLAGLTDARLTLVGVFPTSLFPLPGLTDRATLRAQTTRSLRSARDSLAPGAGIQCIPDLSVPRALRHYAERTNADIVVLGSSPSAAPGHVAIGRRGRQLLYDAPFALALAARGLHEQPGWLRAIGVGYDSGPEADAALTMASELAHGAGDVRLLVRHIVPDELPALTLQQWMAVKDWDHANFWKERRRAALAETQSAVSHLPVRAETSALVGDPGYALRDFSATVDLLVVGSRRWGPLARLVSGGVGETLMSDARCSTLIVPRPPRQRRRTAARSSIRAPITA